MGFVIRAEYIANKGDGTFKTTNEWRALIAMCVCFALWYLIYLGLIVISCFLAPESTGWSDTILTRYVMIGYGVFIFLFPVLPLVIVLVIPLACGGLAMGGASIDCGNLNCSCSDDCCKLDCDTSSVADGCCDALCASTCCDSLCSCSGGDCCAGKKKTVKPGLVSVSTSPQTANWDGWNT